MNKQLATYELDDKKIELITRTVAVGATPDELKLFLYQARRTGLDPLARQIYFVKRAGKATIQTSIDGFRVIAERSGSYAGQDKPEFEEVGNQIKSCTVTVYRFNKGVRYPAGVGVAYWSEYCPGSGLDFMWKKMPHTMISKCAEALALRKAFPQDLSGLYTAEEMEQSGKAEEIVNVEEEITADEEGLPQVTAKAPEVHLKQCQACSKVVTPAEENYSLKNYQMLLCYTCQKKAKGPNWKEKILTQYTEDDARAVNGETF